LVLLIPLTVEARYGWYFSDISIFGGQQYRFGQYSFWGFELSFDHALKSCIIKPRYYGVGLIYSVNYNQSEIGLKGSWNPTRLVMPITRSIKFYPYIFMQGNMVYTKNNIKIGETDPEYGYNFRPGLGLTGNFRESSIVSIRTILQVGYNIGTANAKTFKEALAIEVKIGLGLNIIAIKRNKHQNNENSQ
jgi:hypothetical protein